MRNLILVLLLAGCGGTRVGYIDPDRAVQQTDEWRAVQGDAKAYADSRQPEIDAAKDAVQKARAAKAPAEEIVARETKYGEVAGQIDQEVKRRLNAGGQKIYQAEQRLFESFVASEHVDVIAPVAGAIYIDPKVDLTAKLAKRYDAQAGSATVQQVADLTAQVADLKAQQAKQGSPPLAKK